MKSKSHNYRRNERFDLNRHAELFYIENHSSHNVTVLVHNISCRGALLSSENYIPDENDLELRTELPDQRNLFGGTDIELIFTGKVVRRDEFGRVGLCFEKDYRIGNLLA